METNQIATIAAAAMEKSSVDPEFRALALQDGTAAVEQLIGSKLPDGLKVRFVENGDAWFTLGLPPVRTTDELNDSELEAVAGGRGNRPGIGGIADSLRRYRGV